MASSDNAFPYKLKEIGFSSHNFNKFIFAGEVSPASMFTLLTNRWGMGENLATAFLNFYGGHIYDAYKAMSDLARHKEECKQMSPWVTTLDVHAIPQCLKINGSDDQALMKKVLKTLVTRGFADIESTPSYDNVTEWISSKNIGGIVVLDATVVGLPTSTFGIHKQIRLGLVPSKHSIRLLTAAHLA